MARYRWSQVLTPETWSLQHLSYLHLYRYKQKIGIFVFEYGNNEKKTWVYSLGTKGLQLRWQWWWLPWGCCTSTPVLQSCLGCHSSSPASLRHRLAQKCWRSRWRRKKSSAQSGRQNSLVYADCISNVLSYLLPFNDVEVVAIIVLVNYVLAIHAELLKHGIQHLWHLLLWCWVKYQFSESLFIFFLFFP